MLLESIKHTPNVLISVCFRLKAHKKNKRTFFENLEKVHELLLKYRSVIPSSAWLKHYAFFIFCFFLTVVFIP